MRRIWLVAVLLVLTGCTSMGTSQHTAELVDYRPGPGDTQITVNYGIGTDSSDIHADVAAEDATQVRIRITYRQSNGMHDSILLVRTVVLDLAAPLGNRKVVGYTGTEVPAVTPT